MKSKFHILFEKEKFSDMFAHFGAAEQIFPHYGAPIHIHEFEEELAKTGFDSTCEVEEHIKQIFKDDESLSFAVVLQDGRLWNMFTRDSFKK